jgi:hypothetical protein
MIYSCITLADNIGDWKGPGSEVPPQYVIEKLKQLLEMDIEPEWYKYYMKVDEMIVSVDGVHWIYEMW